MSNNPVELNEAIAGAHSRSGGGIPASSEVRSPGGLRQFNLSRRFALLSLAVIALVSVASSVVLSRFLATEMLTRDAEVARQFIRSSVMQRGAEDYFLRQPRQVVTRAEVEDYFSSLARMPDVLRCQVYDAAGEILWSNDRRAISQAFDGNPELERALRGELVVEADMLEHREYIKPEHLFAHLDKKQFAEYYIPVWDNARQKVVGVVELYKSPEALFASIRSGLQLIWTCGLAGGLLMYAALFWVVRRGDRIIRDQQRRIASSEGFAAVGEIAATVAHNIRNPLASIRSSSELLASEGNSEEEIRSFANDITGEVDRLEVWIRSLLSYAHAGTRAPARIEVNGLLQALVAGLRDDLARQGVRIEWQLQPLLPVVLADKLMLEQIVRTLIANACEAMQGGGTIRIETRPYVALGRFDWGRFVGRSRRGPGVEVTIADTGVGIPAEQLRRAFTAPRTTKANGLGIGLPLVGRTIERMGGGVRLRSTPGAGTVVTFNLPHSAEDTGAS